MGLSVFAIVFIAFIELGWLLLPVGSVGAPALWFPSGVLLGGLIIGGRRQWLAVIAMASAIVVASTLAHGAPIIRAVALAAMTVAEGAAAAWLVQRRVPGPFTLLRTADSFALVGAGIVAGAAGSVIAIPLTPTRALWAWQAWGLSSVLGMMLLTPVVVAWWHERRVRFELATRARVVEFALVIGGTVLMTQLVFGGVVPAAVQVPAFSLPFFIWAAFRFGPAVSALTMLVICVTGLGYTAGGVGPLAMPDAAVDYSIWRSQAAVGMASVSFLLLASVAAERTLALAEIKTLRGFIPICAWCHKVRDDEGFWQRLETYLGDNTDATISHSICPSCSEKQHQAVEHEAVGSGAPWKI